MRSQAHYLALIEIYRASDSLERSVWRATTHHPVGHTRCGEMTLVKLLGLTALLPQCYVATPRVVLCFIDKKKSTNIYSCCSIYDFFIHCHDNIGDIETYFAKTMLVLLFQLVQWSVQMQIQIDGRGKRVWSKNAFAVCSGYFPIMPTLYRWTLAHEFTKSGLVSQKKTRRRDCDALSLWKKTKQKKLKALRGRHGGAVAALMPNSNKVLALNMVADWSLSVVSLHILSLPVWVFSEGAGFLPQP